MKQLHLLGNVAVWCVMSAIFQFMIKYFHLQYINLLIMVLNFLYSTVRVSYNTLISSKNNLQIFFCLWQVNNKLCCQRWSGLQLTPGNMCSLFLWPISSYNNHCDACNVKSRSVLLVAPCNYNGMNKTTKCPWRYDLALFKKVSLNCLQNICFINTFV